MKKNSYKPVLLLFLCCIILILSLFATSTAAFVPLSTNKTSNNKFATTIMSNNNKESDEVTTATPPCAGGEPHPFSILPGDPSLVLITNVDLGDKKLEIMKACSKAICSATGKPESYIAVSITDNASVIFGGSDAPAALASLYSIGAIATESNGKITSDVTDLLEPFGVAENRIYINFFDMPRSNVGWSRRTFAG